MVYPCSGWQTVAGRGLARGFLRGAAGWSLARGKSEHLQTTCRVEHAGAWRERAGSRKVSQKTNRLGAWGRRKPSVGAEVRVKRRGKSPPPDGQPAGHEKPRVVQGKTGDKWRLVRTASAGLSPGISRTLLRQGVPLRRDERNGRPRQNSAYRQPPKEGALRKEGAFAFWLVRGPGCG